MHKTVDPAILYFGTPVLLVSSTNEDGSPNLAPISSAWWLGWNCMLGFGARSKTPQNILRTGECVINLPSDREVAAVNRLARLTGSNPVPPHKERMGYRFEADKFAAGGFTTLPSVTVRPPRVAECPVQLEATLTASHGLCGDDADARGKLIALEMKIRKVHVAEELLVPGREHRIDPDAWRPLIMSFAQFYGLGPRLHPSTLAEIPESLYRPQPSAAERVA